MRFKPLNRLKEYGGTQIILGKDLNSGNYVVEKRLTTKDNFVAELFQNEKAFLKRLNHSNIIRFLGEGEDSLSFFIEYAEFGDLKFFIKKNPNYKYKGMFVKQILEALIYLHKQGIVHNDLNPGNILVTRKNKCKLADFAFAGEIGTLVFPNKPQGVAIGMKEYSFCKNYKIHDKKNDIYAFGKILLEIILEKFEKQSLMFLNEIKKPGIKRVIIKCINGEYAFIENTYIELAQITDNFSLLQ